MKQSGKCLCGAVRFEADGVETHHHACHCGMCRRWSGGSPFFGYALAGDQPRWTEAETLARMAPPGS